MMMLRMETKKKKELQVAGLRATCKSLGSERLFFDGYGCHGRSFEQTYRCYPTSFIDKPQIENGDKIIIPPSALDRLDCEVDFAPPLDYKEPERDAPSRPSKAPAEVQEAATEVEPKFNPFTGGARHLDGKSLKQQPPPSSSSVSSDKQADVTNGGKKFGAAPSSQTSSRQSQGKLVFGSNANRAPEKQKVYQQCPALNNKVMVQRVILLKDFNSTQRIRFNFKVTDIVVFGEPEPPLDGLEFSHYRVSMGEVLVEAQYPASCVVSENPTQTSMSRVSLGGTIGVKLNGP
ncbi:hypothetical protein BC332_22523 [Capsicum chinense]|nr:hypothetical protein BC332_22523 [Capsicum chinense]